MVKILK